MTKRARLLVDQRRVICSATEVSARMEVFASEMRCVGLRGRADLLRVTQVINLVSYHLACDGEFNLADGLLSKSLQLAIRIRDNLTVTVGDIPVDALLNRLRIVALREGECEAVRVADLWLNRLAMGTEVEEGHWFGTSALGRNTDSLLQAIRVERAVLAWRCGLPADSGSVISGTPLDYELQLRRQLRSGNAPPFAIFRDDTVKRALHRLLIYADEGNLPRTSNVERLIERAIGEILFMTFVCPSTPARWSQLLLDELYARGAASLLDDAQYVAIRAKSQARSASEQSLKSLMGEANFTTIPSMSESASLLVAAIDHVCSTISSGGRP